MTLIEEIEAFLERANMTAMAFGELINQRQIVYRLRNGYKAGPGLRTRLLKTMAEYDPQNPKPPIAVGNPADVATRRASTVMADRMNGLIAKMASEQAMTFNDGLVLAHMGPKSLAILQGARS